MLKLVALAIFSILSIDKVNGGCALFGNCGFGGNIVIGLVAFLSSQFTEHFQIYRGPVAGVSSGCSPMFGWKRNLNKRLTLKVAINENIPRANLRNGVTKGQAIRAIKRAVNKWATIPEEECRKQNIDLRLKIVNNRAVTKNVKKTVAQCLADNIRVNPFDNDGRCARDQRLDNNNIDIFIKGWIAGKYFNKIEKGGAKKIAAITVYFDKNNNILSINGDERRRKKFKQIHHVEIFFNNAFKWGIFPDGRKLPKNTLDIESVALHELGDALIYKTNSDDIINEFITTDGNTLMITNPAISNPFLGVRAKQTLLDYDFEIFCDLFNSGVANANANVNGNALQSAFNVQNNKMVQYGFLFGCVIIVLLLLNMIVTTCFNNRGKSQKGKLNNYAKVDMVSTESETDMANI